MQETAVRPREDPARKDVKRQRREAQLETRRRMEEAQRRRQMMIWGGGIALAVIALGALIWWLVHPEPGPAVQSLPIQGAIHVQHGASHPEYNSKPPTSGWHYADQVASWGIATTPWSDELQIHALEHGGIIISYDCADGCPDTVSKLTAIMNGYPSKVILQPYPGIGHRIALTAWGKLAYLDNADEAFIRRFISSYKDKGPEFVPDM